MREYIGKGVSFGIAIGKIKVLGKPQRELEPVKVADTGTEIVRFQKATEILSLQLVDHYKKAVKEVGEENASIFRAHQMLLLDEAFVSSVENIIRSESVRAEYAVKTACDDLVKVFEAIVDENIAGRASDIKDLSKRLISVLHPSDKKLDAGDMIDSDEPVIIVAEELTPSETIQLDKDKVLAFVTAVGSANSHTAIIARSRKIPAIVGADIPLDETIDGKPGIVDGFSGALCVEPDEEILAQMKKKQTESAEEKQLLGNLKEKENITIDGKSIKLLANINNIKDLDAVKESNAEGVGLFRSEFIFLERDNFPSEEEQFEIYRTAAEAMEGKPVIIRTLDIGADKQCAYFNLEDEKNPALGLRGIRLCLSRPEIFKTQLRALYRASSFGDISIMFPMIISTDEVRQIKAIISEVKAELDAEGISYGNPRLGLMIETPAAVMISRLLAKEVDFFSIGTNDLTQYTLAIDRENAKLDGFCETHHPAILEMIRMVVENAHAEGIPVGICGELGADASLTETFIKMGIDELSVSTENILSLRNVIGITGSV